MKVVNAVKFIFPGISENERTARAVVSAFLVQLDPTVEELADIRTAVSEAVTNAIVHGYRKSRGDVELHMKLLEDREVYLRIKDHGCGIADITQAMQPLFTTAPEEERAGLGFAVMESFMDKLQVKSAPEKGTTVTMRKKLGSLTCRVKLQRPVQRNIWDWCTFVPTAFGIGGSITTSCTPQAAWAC